MKLYYMPGACSLTVHIALIMSGRAFEAKSVDYATRKTSDGQNFWDINPKGYVPALEVADGRVFTEIPVILQYLDVCAPKPGLLPANEEQKLRALEWLHFLATEIHKSFSPLFRPDTPSSFLKVGRLHLCKRVTVIERSLRSGPYVMGADFSAVDLYLYTLCRWFPDQDLDISQWPLLHEHYQRLAAKKAVRAALTKEGLR